MQPIQKVEMEQVLLCAHLKHLMLIADACMQKFHTYKWVCTSHFCNRENRRKTARPPLKVKVQTT